MAPPKLLCCILCTVGHPPPRSTPFSPSRDALSPFPPAGAADLSGEEDGGVVVLRVPVARGVEALLPAAEVAQGEPAIVRHLGACCCLLHHQHLHHHQADGVPQAGMLVDASCHGHQGQDVVLWGKRWAGRAWVKLLQGNWFCLKRKNQPHL